MEEAAARMGAGSGGTRNIGGNTHPLSISSANWPTFTARKARCSSPRAMSRTNATFSTLAKLLPGCLHLLRRAQSRLHDRGHPQVRLREAGLAAQRPRHLEELLARGGSRTGRN